MTSSRSRGGNAPVSWGVYEADRPNPPFARVLDDIAAAGYAGTELGPYGYLPTGQIKFRQADIVITYRSDSDCLTDRIRGHAAVGSFGKIRRDVHFRP